MLPSVSFRYIPEFCRAWIAQPCFLFALAIALHFTHLRAEDGFAAKVGAAEARLDEGRSTLDETLLVSAKQMFERCIRESAGNSRCYYDLGRADSYLVDVMERHKDKQGALRALDSAIENTQRFDRPQR